MHIDFEHLKYSLLLSHSECLWKHFSRHGDLLTFQKMRQARLLRVSSVSAVDRLDFLGLFRLGLFHLVETYVIVNVKSTALLHLKFFMGCSLQS